MSALYDCGCACMSALYDCGCACMSALYDCGCACMSAVGSAVLTHTWGPGCDECKAQFQRVARAYEVLSDAMKRRIYDSEQKLMEKSIQSNTIAITTANYKGGCSSMYTSVRRA
jgi:hypothetical protein